MKCRMSNQLERCTHFVPVIAVGWPYERYEFDHTNDTQDKNIDYALQFPYLGRRYFAQLKTITVI